MKAFRRSMYPSSSNQRAKSDQNTETAYRKHRRARALKQGEQKASCARPSNATPWSSITSLYIKLIPHPLFTRKRI
jgi:hypothetical protein